MGGHHGEEDDELVAASKGRQQHASLQHHHIGDKAKPMFAPPVICKRLSLAVGTEEEERSATWSELFLDLVFASVIAALGDHLKETTMPLHECVAPSALPMLATAKACARGARFGRRPQGCCRVRDTTARPVCAFTRVCTCMCACVCV